MKKKITKKQIYDDIRGLKNDNNLKTVSRNYYRRHGKFNDADVCGVFGTWSEVLIHCGIKPSRLTAKLHTDIAKHNSLDDRRDFYNEQVLPWIGKYDHHKRKKTGRITALINSDLHDLECDRFSLDVFMDMCKRVQPERVILNGDIFDNYEFSRFDKDPRQIQIGKRFDFVKNNVFGEVRKAVPDADIDLIIGNHELRILKMLSTGDGVFFRLLMDEVLDLNLSKIFGLEEFGINLVSKLDLATWTKAEENEQAKQNYKLYHDCFVACHEKNFNFGVDGTSGHVHKPSITPGANIHRPYKWMVTPGMCVTNLEYVGGMPTAHIGFGMVHIDITHKTVVQELIDTTSNFTNIAGKEYLRKGF